MTLHPIEDLRSTVEAAAAELGNGSTATPTLERPKKAGFGDYSTNAAMLLAPRSARRRARSPSGCATC